eukprot:TRINITY_DN13702_c0_g1_i1.p1 TRINITY_DN13702_c0_g1~~TRINITY_DN13702_c0_g1_i1.p1  ORF type:complete len:338 (+),score=50.82 TRINITY_DN13702_c0_g1_i1:712-1725(+)
MALYEGTFAWTESGTPLPNIPVAVPSETPILKSWGVYFSMRGVKEVSPAMTDGLSYVLTLCAALKKLGVSAWEAQHVDVIVAGASLKAEQHVLNTCNYWEEIGVLLPNKSWTLHFVGPEVDQVLPSRMASYCSGCGGAATHLCKGCRLAGYCGAACQVSDWKSRHKHSCKTKNSASLSQHVSVKVFKGTLHDYLEKENFNTSSTVVYGCNTGFGSGNPPLMESWVPDLSRLASSAFLCLMSCANTWSDLRGEVLLLQTMYNVDLCLAPASNPFKAVTVKQDEAPEPTTSIQKWYCANYCLYAFKGDPAAQLPPLDTLRAQTEQVAPMFQEFKPTAIE